MTVRDAMCDHPRCVPGHTEIIDAARLMATLNVGSLPICADDRLVGIVTDRDITTRFVAHEARHRHISAIMTHDPVTIAPDESLEHAQRVMAQYQLRRLPVCDDDGHVVGILSQADIARHATREDTGALLEAISAPRAGVRTD